MNAHPAIPNRATRPNRIATWRRQWREARSIRAHPPGSFPPVGRGLPYPGQFCCTAQKIIDNAPNVSYLTLMLRCSILVSRSMGPDNALPLE
jgi:hypothetical protein